MKTPLPELIDRYTIAKLKAKRLGDEHSRKEFHEYKKAMADAKKNGVRIERKWVERLYSINRQMWDNGHEIRCGRGSNLGLEEIGRRYLKTRDLNKKRIAVKNEIARETGLEFMDIKMNERSHKHARAASAKRA